MRVVLPNSNKVKSRFIVYKHKGHEDSEGRAANLFLQVLHALHGKK